jgi:hypothetical protein
LTWYCISHFSSSRSITLGLTTELCTGITELLWKSWCWIEWKKQLFYYPFYHIEWDKVLRNTCLHNSANPEHTFYQKNKVILSSQCYIIGSKQLIGYYFSLFYGTENLMFFMVMPMQNNEEHTSWNSVTLTYFENEDIITINISIT